jgi:hypothetical protein
VGEVCKGEGVTFRASEDNINTVTTVVGEDRAKIVGAVPARVPRNKNGGRDC